MIYWNKIPHNKKDKCLTLLLREEKSEMTSCSVTIVPDSSLWLFSKFWDKLLCSATKQTRRTVGKCLRDTRDLDAGPKIISQWLWRHLIPCSFLDHKKPKHPFWSIFGLDRSYIVEPNLWTKTFQPEPWNDGTGNQFPNNTQKSKNVPMTRESKKTDTMEPNYQQTKQSFYSPFAWKA